ncbi:HAD family hydrolase [Clostridium sp. MB40-C1]|uniref:HAD family hydrolase n=1 Tax=Clostridium sp. MB40-C1 TaxID=3070996 RepID=UPI0027DF99ED|nr:HAD family hydrolase [Clostridium sp. MB40-C1]WMJ81577.1 HAD family hydrolase [Clostridium sp. MB40-C1]
MRYSHVVFDIDGTLIDSEKAVLNSLQKTILEEKGIEKSLEELRFALGIPGKVALSRLDIENLEEVEEKWDEYSKEYCHEITLFDGIRYVVQALKSKSIKLGIITSKTRKEYESDFVRFGLDSYFDVVICADDTKKHKPNGDPMEKYLEIANARREDTIYIGDSIYDMQCAKNAGVHSVLALWGRDDCNNLEATYKLNNPKDILDILIEYNNSSMK